MAEAMEGMEVLQTAEDVTPQVSLWEWTQRIQHKTTNFISETLAETLRKLNGRYCHDPVLVKKLDQEIEAHTYH